MVVLSVTIESRPQVLATVHQFVEHVVAVLKLSQNFRQQTRPTTGW